MYRIAIKDSSVAGTEKGTFGNEFPKKWTVSEFKFSFANCKIDILTLDMDN